MYHIAISVYCNCSGIWIPQAFASAIELCISLADCFFRKTQFLVLCIWRSNCVCPLYSILGIAERILVHAGGDPQRRYFEIIFEYQASN